MKFVTTNTNGKNSGSCVYMMASDSSYQMFKVKNQEFTFDVDVSKLPCGLNRIPYFSAMDVDGVLSKYTNNKAGAKYGTGYCDAQCSRDTKFINGEGNVIDWTGASNDANSGKGRYGTCCNKMDVWEANSISTAYTPHPCSPTGQTRCDSTDSSCTTTCGQAGCDFHSYRMAVTGFYGPGSSSTIHTTKKLTAVTQFITDDGTASGALSEIRRIYVQGGKFVTNSKANISGMSSFDSGGFSKMSKAFDAGMVLVWSIWDDHTANMLWLDSNYPTDRPATQSVVTGGTCATTSGVPADIESQSDGVQVIYSNIKFGDIGFFELVLALFTNNTVCRLDKGPAKEELFLSIEDNVRCATCRSI
ncbi:beta-1,4-D-glucan cellobiohydrolase [Ceratobasidium sp. AG-Ba]|nr:beta-1,4-D-glucan cellobiohydrolase [Ceratobasidium sp. AG-Ba]